MGVGALQGPSRIYSYKKGPPNGSCGFWWKNLLTTAKLRLGREEQGGKHPLFLLWSSSLLPAPRGAQLLQPPGAQRSVDLVWKQAWRGKQKTSTAPLKTFPPLRKKETISVLLTSKEPLRIEQEGGQGTSEFPPSSQSLGFSANKATRRKG